MSETNKTNEQRDRVARDDTAGSQQPPVTNAPRSSEDGPPSHEETLGALPGVPKSVADEYSRTGRTPKSYTSRIGVTAEDAERRGLPANPGTAGQAPFPEDQEKAAKDQQKAAETRQRDQQRESNDAGNRRAARPQ